MRPSRSTLNPLHHRTRQAFSHLSVFCAYVNGVASAQTLKIDAGELIICLYGKMCPSLSVDSISRTAIITEAAVRHYLAE